MIELIFTIVLLISLIGVGVILFRRMPDLVSLPEQPILLQKVVIFKIKQGVRRLPGIRGFSYEIYLQKVLSRIRVLTLKTDSKTSGWLERLRQRQTKNNGSNNDKYWEELKKAKDGK